MHIDKFAEKTEKLKEKIKIILNHKFHDSNLEEEGVEIKEEIEAAIENYLEIVTEDINDDGENIDGEED